MKKFDRSIKTLTGRPASGGFAVGRPRIIRQRADLKQVTLGDVLVAAETDIAFVPAMQRAAAIITETGGRFCHAAVWARENKKPTILQVDNATHALEGVQNVLVDAETGTIEWEV